MSKAKNLFVTQPSHKSPKSLMAMWRDEKATARLKSPRSFDMSCQKSRSNAQLASPSSRGIQFYNSKRRDKAVCTGNFCRYILSTIATQERDEADYDEIVRQARSIYTGQGDKEATHFRLEMQLEYLKTEKEKARTSLVSNSVSYKCILRGRQILKRAGLMEMPQTDMELDIRRLINSIANPVMDARDKEELALKAKQCPYYFYEQVNVCDRCFAVYSQISQYFKKKKIKKKLVPTKPMSPFQPQNTPSPQATERPKIALARSKQLFMHLLSPAIASKTARDQFYHSPIGKINKNSINDLLTDMNHVLNPSLTNYYKSMTLNSQTRNLQIQHSIESITYIPSPYVEDLAKSSQQFFVLDTLNPIRMKDPKIEGRKTWLKYRRRLNLNIAPTS